MQFMIGFNYTEFIDGLTYLVKKQFIPMSRVDDAVKRILRVKFTMGLFENPLADYSMVKYLGSQVIQVFFLIQLRTWRTGGGNFDPFTYERASFVLCLISHG